MTKMPGPWTAVQWAEFCAAYDHARIRVTSSLRKSLLCLDCACAYARQVGEADRARTIEFLEIEVKHKDWKPVIAMFKRLIVAIRALPVETP